MLTRLLSASERRECALPDTDGGIAPDALSDAG
jgi:hypothetical protein